jgi:small nuclear ribonucleoprotein (snRNP)-like protein
VPSWTQVTSPTAATIDTNPLTATTFPQTIVTWTFSNIGNRTASAAYTAADVNKVCYQTDTNTYWRLAALTNKSGSNYTPMWIPALQADRVTMNQWDGTNATALRPAANNGSGVKGTLTTYDKIYNVLTTSDVIMDNRENGLIRLTSLNVNGFSTLATDGTLSNFSGVLYISDFGATYVPPSGVIVAGNPVTCTVDNTHIATNVVRRAIRLRNGATLLGKLTIVSDNPIYIQGDYNTGVNPPSNSGTYTSPTASGYTRWASAVIGDSINVLSNAWTDANSISNRPQRVPTNTTVNTALVSGNVPSGGGNYSGGGENFVRFLEDWNKNANTFCYYGSMVQLYKSQQGTGVWSSGGQSYQAPILKWYYDINFSADHNDNAHWGSPPGNLQIAAYLQQQRWYQVY